MRNCLISFILIFLCLSILAVEAFADDTLVLTDGQVLVNASHGLAEDFVPENLSKVSLFMPVNAEVSLRSDAALALRDMIAGLESAGISGLYASSGYRSFDRQNVLHAAKVAYYRQMGKDGEQAKAAAARWVLPAGFSEHQTGLAVDVTHADVGFALVEAFAQTPAGSWLAEHAAEYGFILRYTAEKEYLTGVASEPWHFRYIGKDHAYYMQKNDLCLEEYHALIHAENPLIFVNDVGEKRAIYYCEEDFANILEDTLSRSLASYDSNYFIITTCPSDKPLVEEEDEEPLDTPIVERGLSSYMPSVLYMNYYQPAGSLIKQIKAKQMALCTSFPCLCLPIIRESPPLADEEEVVYSYYAAAISFCFSSIVPASGQLGLYVEKLARLSAARPQDPGFRTQNVDVFSRSESLSKL
ncbi:MAG: M15 family metallopeptidase [Clostridiales bacterium]|nr:M15 family metallopeptidase [Clostridiales bacterium]